MNAKASIEEIKALFPEQHRKIEEAMAKKGIATADIQWEYDWCVRIGNPNMNCSDWKSMPVPKDPETLQEFEDEIKDRYGVSLIGKSGRKRNAERVDIKHSMPKMFKDIAASNHQELTKRTNKDSAKTSNLDSVLKAVGKSGSSAPIKTPSGGGIFGMIASNIASQSIVYPTLDDIRSARPDIAQKYENMADGTKLVVFNPQATDSDEWGFSTMDIKLATRRDNQTRVIVDEKGLCASNYVIFGDTAKWNGNLRGIEKAIAASEGSEFRGWKNTKQYRYSKDEIKTITGRKIYTFGLSF